MRPRVRTCMAGALLLLAAAAPEASAQLRVVPRAGIHAPLTRLGRVATDQGERALGRPSPSPAFALGVEVGRPDATSVRLDGLFGTQGPVPVIGPGCEADGCRARASLAALTASVVFRPLPPGALTNHTCSRGRESRSGRRPWRGAARRRTPSRTARRRRGERGWGWSGPWGSSGGVLEVSDLVSGSAGGGEGDGGIRHDLVVTVGLVLG